MSSKNISLSKFDELLESGNWSRKTKVEALKIEKLWDGAEEKQTRLYTGYISMISKIKGVKVKYIESFSFYDKDMSTLQLEHDCNGVKIEGVSHQPEDSIVYDGLTEFDVYKDAVSLCDFQKIDYGKLESARTVYSDDYEGFN